MKAQINGFSYSNLYAGHSFNKNRMGSKMASTIIHSTILLVETIFAIYFALSINQSSFDILEEVFSLVTNSTYYPFIFYGLISLKLMALVSYLLIQKGIEQLLFIKIRALSSEFYSFLKQMDLALAKLLLTLNLLQNIFPFCISLLLQARQIILVKQYIHRRHDYYVGFIDQYIKLRVLRIAFTLLNAVSYFLSMPNLFKIGFSLLFVIQMWILTKNKFQITLQKFPDLIICAEAAVHFTIEFIIVQYFFSQVNFGTASLAKYSFTFLGSFIYFLFCKDYYFQYKAFEWITKKDRKLQIKVFSTQVFRILENGALNLDDRHSKANIRSCHLLMKCLNKNCQIQEESDPFSNNNYSSEITQSGGQQAMLLSFVDCLYETEIQKFTNCKRQKGLIFDYCQFLLNTDHKIYRLLFLVSKLQQMKLGFIETQQIQKFRYYLQTYLSNLCASLYQGKANFERAEIGQKTIQSIKDSIDEYLRQYKMIWHRLKDGLIEAEELKQTIKSNSYLLEKIDSKWEKIYDCLKLSLIWNKWHLIYSSFIRNQYKWEIKKQLGQFQSFDKFINTIKLGQAQIKLGQNLFSHLQIGFISSFLRDQELFINWVNQSYTLKTGFGLQELKFSPLESIYVEREKQNYCQFLGKLMKFDEKMFAPLKSHICEKQKGQSAVLMLFKPIFYIQKGLTFLTLVKFQEQLTRTIQLRSSPQIIKNKQIENVEIQDNIFAKDSNFVFREDHYDMISYYRLSRIITLICACFLLLTMTLVNSNYSRLMDYSEQFISFMHLYRFPMILNINYMRSFLNIGNQAKVIKTIQLTTQLMRAAAMNQKTIKTLFDPALNSQRQYSANEMAPDIINVTYNRIDLFFTIVNSIVAINSSNVDLLGFQYKRFAALLKPSYDIMANSTKFNLHNQFQGLLSQSKYFTIIITIVGVFITLIPSLLMLRALRDYLHKQEETYQIIHNFRGVYYQEIIDYLTRISTYFQFATNAQQTNHHKYRREQQTFRTNDISNYGTLKQPHPPSNKKAKMRKLFYFVFSTFIGLMVFTFATFQIFNHTKLSNLQILEDDGFSFLHFFPAGAILAMGSIEKFYHQNHPSHFVFDNTKYDDAISSVHLFGSIPYKPVSSSASPYLQKRKNYFFGNLCQYNSSLLKEIGLEISVCQKISNGSFKQGVSAYLRYSRSFGGGYLKGEFSVTPNQIDEYIVSVSILNVYVLDTLTSWIQEFKGDCSRQQSLNQFLGYLFAGFIILIHFILNQMVLKRRIMQNNLLKRHTFQYYISRNIILEDKQVRRKLEENGMFHEK